MKRIDLKHIAYHVLIALYFVWMVIFGSLITMALLNVFTHGNPELTRVFIIWIFFNLVMGTGLFIVIRLFRKENLLSSIIFYSYYFMAAVTVTSVLIIRSMA